MRHTLLASLAVFVFAMLWNSLLHGVVLRAVDGQIETLVRPNRQAYLPAALGLTYGLALAFVIGYRRFARDGSLREAMLFGVYFAILAGLLVDLNQYVLYPLPGVVPLAWFVGGLGEFLGYALIARAIAPAELRTSS